MRTPFLRLSALLTLCSACVLPACSSAPSDTTGGVGGAPATTSTGDGVGGTGSHSGGAGGGSAACLPGEIDTSALAFDGVDDGVSMGVAPELGLKKLTIEAWVRRDGAGEPGGTGVGGLKLVPIAGKGRGESDGTTLDCNYSFGFIGDTLGADFEDLATGENHPVVGTRKIPMGEWHHLAASYDGTTWRLYIDAVLDAELVVNETPRFDSIQHFGIGTSFDSKGVAAGHLQGAVDEVRVWDHARTSADLAGAMNKALTQGTGLVGRWALDEKDGSVLDSVGKNNGTLAGGASFAKPGAFIESGTAPTLAAPSPADQDVVTGSAVELGVTLEDPDSEPLGVTFHVREVSVKDDFTIAVLPDTQYYTVEGKGREHYFYDQTKWILANRTDYNIVATIHNGDLVDNGDIDYQWSIAEKAMSPLEKPLPSLPDGLPYGISVGNHDESPNSAASSTVKFNQHFGVERFAGRSYYGGHYAAKNDDSWFTFTAGGLEFVVVNMQFDATPSAAVLAWARAVFLSHPKAFGILNSHYILGATGNFGAQGKAIYAALRDVDNVQLMTCGHVSAESRRTDTFEGNVIHSMLADYQGRANGGGGSMRVWEFSPANSELTVRTYSPTAGKWETDEDSEFTLKIDLPGAGGAFKDLTTLESAPNMATATFDGLKPKTRYEWYATVKDCVHTVDSPIYRFTTK